MAQEIEKTKQNFVEAMDDDFNTSKALAVVFNLVSVTNAILGDDALYDKCKNTVKQARDTIIDLMAVFGLDLNKAENINTSNNNENLPDSILDLAQKFADCQSQNKQEAANALLEARTIARNNKD